MAYVPTEFIFLPNLHLCLIYNYMETRYMFLQVINLKTGFHCGTRASVTIQLRVLIYTQKNTQQ